MAKEHLLQFLLDLHQMVGPLPGSSGDFSRGKEKKKDKCLFLIPISLPLVGQHMTFLSYTVFTSHAQARVSE